MLVEKNKTKHPTTTSLHLGAPHPLVKITYEVNKQDNSHSFFLLIISFYVKDSLLSVIVNLLLNNIYCF